MNNMMNVFEIINNSVLQQFDLKPTQKYYFQKKKSSSFLLKWILVVKIGI